MKIITFLTVNLCCVVLLAQNIEKNNLPNHELNSFSEYVGSNKILENVIYESFEESFPPTGWISISEGTSANEWESTSLKAKSGSKSVRVNYSTATETMNEWLITAPIDLSGLPSVKLRFYEEEEYWANYGKVHFVKISTESQSDLSTFQTLLEMNPYNHTISGFDGEPVEIDLSNYINDGIVYIAFQYTGSNADRWYIDDVSVAVPYEHDIRLLSINLAHNFSKEETIVPSITVKNIGLNIESFSVDFGFYKWEGSEEYLDNKEVLNLNVGESRIVNFDSYSFNSEMETEYNYFARANLNTDLDTENNLAIHSMNTFSFEKNMVLVEKGTGTWCGYCYGAALSLEKLEDLYPNSLAALAYHSGDDYANEDSRSRIAFYGITGFPTAIFNGINRQVGGSASGNDWTNIYNLYESKLLEELSKKTAFSLESWFNEKGETFSVYSKINYHAKTFNKSYRLFYALNESHIAENWQTLDSLHFVARSALSTVNGNIFNSNNDEPYIGMTLFDTLQFQIPDNVVEENCELITFIQDLDTKEVMAVHKLDLNDPITGINDESNKLTFKKKFYLGQNYPNPFNPNTIINYAIPAKSQVTLKVYNLLGKELFTLVNKEQNSGNHNVDFDASNISSGIYFYKLQAGNFVETKKMILLK